MTSRPDSAPRHWSEYLQDMIMFCENSLLYTEGLDRDGFQAGGPMHDATLWCIALVGEAANKIPVNIRQRQPSIPWREIIVTRNRLIHHYFGIDDDFVWDTITVYIPELLPRLYTLLESAEQ